MDDAINSTLAGTIGYVWPFFGDPDRQDRDYAAHLERENDRLKLAILAPQPIGFGRGSLDEIKRIPEAVLAVTEVGSTLVFDISHTGGAMHIGGTKASSLDFYARAIAVGFPAEDLQSQRMYEMTAYFPGLEHWCNITGSTSDTRHDQYNRPTEIVLTIKAAAEQVCELSESHRIKVSTHFEVTGPADNRQVYTPLSISSVSDEPIPWWEHQRVLTRIQDLISLCWDGLALADGGYVRLDLHDPHPTANAKLWCERLMVLPPAVKQAGPSITFPEVHLETLGGTDALGRWCSIEANHSRAVTPLVSRHRVARLGTMESKLLDICSGIGYWVDYHKHQRQEWTKLHKHESKAGALARRVGHHFEDFVGDSAKWSRLLWDRYDELRHDPTTQHDTKELFLLVSSARVLLTSALLNEVSGDDAPTAALCSAHQNHMIGYEVREDITGVGVCEVPTDDSLFFENDDAS